MDLLLLLGILPMVGLLAIILLVIGIFRLSTR